MQKVVLALDIHADKKCKKRAMKIVTSVAGIDSVSVDMEARKITLVGNMDILEVVKKLKKTYRTEIVAVGPAKEPEKKEPDEPKATHIVDYGYWPYYHPFYPTTYYCY